MTFDLTDALAGEISRALENQEKKFLVDAARGTLVDSSQAVCDEENFYKLPEWDSAAGYALREEFTNALRAPLAKDALQESLHSGRGVFRNFKDALKEFPEVEKLWRRFQYRRMRSYIGGWHDDLREVWGLERLDEPVDDDSGSLAREDFLFQEYESARDKDDIADKTRGLAFDGGGFDETALAASDLLERLFALGESLGHTGFACRAPGGDLAGCILAARISERAKNVAVITNFFVAEAYRGLGIGSELVSLFFPALKKLGFRSVLAAGRAVSDSLARFLERAGFEKTDAGFAATVQ